ncbi:MAG: SMUG2 DNA glycosylase family protein [Bacilli bacterium]|nr:SMUG2 DNA glycosylase family protein [Bacilli bacterium]
MNKQRFFSDSVLEFNEWLANTSLDLPDNYSLNNPFNGKNKEQIKDITNAFYKKYYNDNNKRYLILGSSPARKGTATTGIPFEDASHLYKETGIMIENFYINKSSSNFLYEVMEEYGGCEKFYKDFFMSFVCPLGIINVNSKGNEVNANYYESKKLESVLYDFIVDSLKKQIAFGIDTSVCYCIGSGENFKFLTKINEQNKFFDKIIALEHPRFIMQYNSKDRDKYLKKYINSFNNRK